jgi:hypothetical protein
VKSQRKKLSTTIGAINYAYLDNRATLERRTAAYFEGLSSKAAAAEADLEDALSIASQEMDFDQQ